MFIGVGGWSLAIDEEKPEKGWNVEIYGDAARCNFIRIFLNITSTDYIKAAKKIVNDLGIKTRKVNFKFNLDGYYFYYHIRVEFSIPVIDHNQLEELAEKWIPNFGKRIEKYCWSKECK
jgi:hypothetical protein